jgi:hypothetical protein
MFNPQGRSILGRSILGRSILGHSILGRSILGRLILVCSTPDQCTLPTPTVHPGVGSNPQNVQIAKNSYHPIGIKNITIYNFYGSSHRHQGCYYLLQFFYGSSHRHLEYYY